METDPAIAAVHDLIRRVTTAEQTLERIATAWEQLTHQQKVWLGDKIPDLVDAIIQTNR